VEIGVTSPGAGRDVRESCLAIMKGVSMKTRMPHRLALAVASIWISSGPAFGADAAKPTAADPSPEQRHQMAEIHQRMADCLNSERPMTECRGEMQKSCQETMGAGGCSMMDGHMGAGMMHGQGTGMDAGEPKAKTPSGGHEEHH
jgi:hypothetical protein